MRIVVTGGGTGGHIYPALALIRHIKRTDDTSDVLYIGTDNGMEATIVPREQIPFKTVKISGFKRKLSFDNVKTVLRFLNAVRTARMYLRDFKPDAVIGTGGYVCGPVVYAAAKMGIPTVIHEQNSVPGLTNRFLSRYADKVITSFPVPDDSFPEHKTEMLGNPRASEVVHHVKEDSAGYISDAGLDPARPTILAVGGSRGARPVNEAVTALIPLMGQSAYQLIFVTGESHYEEAIKALNEANMNDRVHVVPYVHDMPAVLREVDLVIARAGATTMAEITALGLPSILIPSPYVTNNHQEKNARLLEAEGAAEVILERDLSGPVLFDALREILSNKDRFSNMEHAASSIGRPEAAEDLTKRIEALILDQKKGQSS